MIIALDLVFVFVIALVMTVLLAAVYLYLGIRFNGLGLFALLFCGTWGAGELMTPVGPLLWDVAWLSLFLAGLACGGLCVGFLLLSRYMARAISVHIDELAQKFGAFGSIRPGNPGPEQVLGVRQAVRRCHGTQGR